MLACAMNEALLQSYDGVLRVAPAASKSGQARFTLHAEGGFVVSAELADGEPQWVAIKSTRGGECLLANPWEEAHLYRNGEHAGDDGARTLRLNTAAGDLWLLTKTPETSLTWTVEPLEYAPNSNAKVCPDDWAQLGLPRMF